MILKILYIQSSQKKNIGTYQSFKVRLIFEYGDTWPGIEMKFDE